MRAPSRPLLLLLLLASAVGATSVAELVLEKGETLEKAARRSGQEGLTAAELRALNGLAPEAPVPPGTKLKLPGRERTLAQGALETARAALQKSPKDTPRRADAQKTLEEADAHFKAARYEEAGRSADLAWSMLAESAQRGTSFAVEVSEQGNTKVKARTGQPLRVEAAGVAKPVPPGTIVRVAKGKPPSEPTPPPSSPALSSPADGGVLRFKPHPKGLGPVRLRWSAVPNAKQYELQVLRPDGEEVHRVLLAGTQAELPRLGAGQYRWTVRALDSHGEASEPAAARGFELAVEPLKLEVKGSQWK